MSDSKSSSGGIGFCGLLTIVFITLKLCKLIDWSWWWVLAPTWIPIAIALLILPFIIYFKIKERKERHKITPFKSKWQERLAEMQEAQKRRGGL